MWQILYTSFIIKRGYNYGLIYEVQGWARPGKWGDWVEIAEVSGSRIITLQIETISQAPSSFDAELEYWEGYVQKNDVFSVPGNIKHTFRMDCVCKPKIRFKSHSMGQIVRIYFIEVHR
jgi:hypothetical protein